MNLAHAADTLSIFEILDEDEDEDDGDDRARKALHRARYKSSDSERIR